VSDDAPTSEPDAPTSEPDAAKTSEPLEELEGVVHKHGSGRVARPFAWAAGLVGIAMTFLVEAMPLERVAFIEPYKDYKWTVIEHVEHIGTFEAFRGPMITAGMLFLFAWLVSWWVNSRKPRPASLELSDDGVELNYRKSWPRHETLAYQDIAAAQAPTPTGLVMHMRSGARFDVESRDAAEAAMAIEARRAAAPGLPAGRGWNSLPFGGTLRWAWALGGYVFLLGSASSAGEAFASGQWPVTLLIGVLTLLWLVVGFTLSSRTNVVVGTDGVTVSHPWRTQFVPYHLIDDIEKRMGVLRLVRKDGRHIFISTKNQERLTADMRAALSRYHNPDARGADHHRSELARGDKTADTWRDDLARLLDKQDYRGARVRVADLVELVGDGHADPEQRVAAALALPKNDETQERIRVAAARCADEDTRAAIEAAAEGEVAAAQLDRATLRFRTSEV
jgi:hypothetical protein